VELAGWARVNGVHPRAARRLFREDRMPVPACRLESGMIWVDAVPADGCGGVVVHARVCPRDRRQDLDRRVARLTGWATASGHAAGEVVTGAGHVEAALAAHGRKVVVAGPGEATGDLVRDMTGVLTLMCARLYGRRAARNRAMRAVTAARHETARAGG
jgi:putative resolvase